jgi:hypothetical protein
VNEGKSGSEGERVQVLGALGNLESKKKLVAKKQREMHILNNQEEGEWIADYVEGEPTGARNLVEDAEALVHQEQQDMKDTELVELTNRESEKTFDEMMVAIGDSLCDLASSDDEEDGKDEDDEVTEQGKLSEDEEHGWVLSTITKTVQQDMEMFWQNKVKLGKLTQPGWDNAAN